MTLRTIAHVKKQEHGRFAIHDLAEHLLSVADYAAANAVWFGASEWAGLAGLWHDLGKYSDAFQCYIKSASGYDAEAHIETTPGKVNHSDAGAQLAAKQFGVYGRVNAYLIAGAQPDLQLRGCVARTDK